MKDSSVISPVIGCHFLVVTYTDVYMDANVKSAKEII
jgi:hypothetical protein